MPIFLVVAALTGCGLHDPYSQKPQRGSATSKGTRARGHPFPRGSSDHVGNITSVVAHYATVWVNWSATTLSRERAELLALSAGSLEDQLHREAAQTVKTRLQEVSKSYSRGRYVGVIDSHGEQVIVVTYEEVALLGDQAQGAYHVYLARIEHTAKGWKLSEWQPATDN